MKNMMMEKIEKENNSLKFEIEQLKLKIKILEDDKIQILNNQYILIQEYKNLIEDKISLK